jgi:transposase
LQQTNDVSRKVEQMIGLARESPYLNTIENLWAICKNIVNKLDCPTKTKMTVAFIKAWYKDDIIKNEVLKNKGGHISFSYLLI